MINDVRNTFKAGDCVMAYCDIGEESDRAMCWIVRKDRQGTYIALVRKTDASGDVLFEVTTVHDPIHYPYRPQGRRGSISLETSQSVSAAIRALASLIS